MNVLIVGGGQTGLLIGQLLSQAGHSLTLIERRRDLASHLSAELPTARIIVGDGSSPRRLREADAHRADTVVAVTGEDENNLVVCLLARNEFNTPLTVARINNPNNAWLFNKRMGVDVAVDQAGIISRLVQEEITVGEMVTLLKMCRGELTLSEQRLRTGSRAVGKKVNELMLPKEIVLVAVFRKGDVLVPRGETILESGDEVLALIKNGSALELSDKLD